MTRHKISLPSGPNLTADEAAKVVRQALVSSGGPRLAFCGPAGAGKTTLCGAISGDPRIFPILNHADQLKEEVLEWVTDVVRLQIQSDQVAWEHFCDFMGVSPSIAEADMLPMMQPVFAAMWSIVPVVKTASWDLKPFESLTVGQETLRKVAFIDAHKPVFRSSLQLYGQISKELAADPQYWVQQTVARSCGTPIALNGDTRFTAEMDVLRSCGWTGVYLVIDEATSTVRRPDLTPAQRAHPSENGIFPADCDLVLDATKPVAEILVDLASYLLRDNETVVRLRRKEAA